MESPCCCGGPLDAVNFEPIFRVLTLSGAATQTLLTAVNFPTNAAMERVHRDALRAGIRMTFPLPKLGVNPKITGNAFLNLWSPREPHRTECHVDQDEV